MSQIIFTKTPSDFVVDMGERTLCVHHESLTPPTLISGKAISFRQFQENPRGWISGMQSLVIVGLNRLITPGNRTAMVFEILFNKTSELYKVSIDTIPFISKPWRLWFHFGITGVPYEEYTYSYIAESHYEAWRNGLRDENPFSLDRVLCWGKGRITSTYATYFAPISPKVIHLPDEIHNAYQSRKARLFQEETSVAKILRELNAFAQSACPARQIPTSQKFFAKEKHDICVTDLPVDRWLVSEINEYAALINGILGGHYGKNGCLQITRCAYSNT